MNQEFCSLNMDGIDDDPIIMYYLKLTDGGQKQEQDDAKLEVTFSEISLRLALSQLLGRNQMLNPADVELYKKIILLYFSGQITDMEQLITFMSPCFDEATVRHLLTPERREQILKEWKQFKATKLIDIVYKNATIAMLKEYHRRLILLQNGNVLELTLQSVDMQLQNALKFLNWNIKRRHKFAKTMLNLLNDKNIHYINNDSTSPVAETSSQSLEMSSIFEAIKEKLNPWLVRMVEDGVSQYASMSASSGKVLHLKRLPANSDDLEDSAVSRKKYRARHRAPSKRIIVEVEEVGYTMLVLNDAPPNETMDEDVGSTHGIIEVDANNDQNNIIEENPAFPKEYGQVNATNNVHHTKIEETSPNSAICKENNDNIEQSNDQEEAKGPNAIDFDTAISYINQLKEYALANELFDAFVPLDQVEDCIRC